MSFGSCRRGLPHKDRYMRLAPSIFPRPQNSKIRRCGPTICSRLASARFISFLTRSRKRFIGNGETPEVCWTSVDVTFDSFEGRIREKEERGTCNLLSCQILWAGERSRRLDTGIVDGQRCCGHDGGGLNVRSHMCPLRSRISSCSSQPARFHLLFTISAPYISSTFVSP